MSGAGLQTWSRGQGMLARAASVVGRVPRTVPPAFGWIYFFPGTRCGAFSTGHCGNCCLCACRWHDKAPEPTRRPRVPWAYGWRRSAKTWAAVHAFSTRRRKASMGLGAVPAHLPSHGLLKVRDKWFSHSRAALPAIFQLQRAATDRRLDKVWRPGEFALSSACFHSRFVPSSDVCRDG